MQWKATMSDTSFGEVIRPSYCRVSVSADRSQLALTFRGPDQSPLTLLLPLLDAAGLQHKLAHSLHLLGVRPVSTQDKSATEPVAI
jgi:hypothetical protein